MWSHVGILIGHGTMMLVSSPPEYASATRRTFVGRFIASGPFLLFEITNGRLETLERVWITILVTETPEQKVRYEGIEHVATSGSGGNQKSHLMHLARTPAEHAGRSCS